MIRLPKMLLVGATDRNAGKTTFASRVIRELRDHDITGVKVTVIRKDAGGCPRGSEGCGVCSSLEGVYMLAREEDANSEKDTGKLLAAGAARVFWLRVADDSVEEGMNALLEIAGRDALMVCESNSLRHAVEPGLFIMMKNKSSDNFKESARSVVNYVDRIVEFDGCNVDFDFSELTVNEGRWCLPADATAIIMAGGDSRRMGRDKSMLPVRGRSLIEHVCDQLKPNFSEVIVSSSVKGQYESLGVPIIPDREDGRGPLMGIASALEASSSAVNFVAACDIPEIDMSFVRSMLRIGGEHDAVVPQTGKTYIEPLFAVYNKGILPRIEELLTSGRFKIDEAFSRARVKYVELCDAEWFHNLNTTDDYEEYREKWQ
ncbi:NTP transferase domain-containing protein [Candidatus Hydrogenedentota bacterium]